MMHGQKNIKLFECCQIELLLSCNWRTLLQGQTVINGTELQAVGTCRAEVTWFRDTFGFDSFNITIFALRWMGGNEKLTSMGYDLKNSLKRRWFGLEVIYRRLLDHATGWYIWKYTQWRINFYLRCAHLTVSRKIKVCYAAPSERS